MCVIVIVKDKRPTVEMVNSMWEKNSDGAGIAWRDTVDGKKVVKWEKGLELTEIQELCAEVPMPYVAHFRIASVGGVVPALTHPFPIEEHHLCAQLEGTTTGSVLFHNGHWNSWKTAVVEGAAGFGKRIPKGVNRWSDSQAMAWLTRLYSVGFLELLDEKTVIFGPTMMEITKGNAWTKVDDIWVSNDFFTKKHYNHPGMTAMGTATSGYRVCRYGQCNRTDSLNADGKCPTHATPALPQGKAEVREDFGKKSPLELRNLLAEWNGAWGAYKDGRLSRTDLVFSKNELNRLQAMVNRLPKESTGPQATQVH